MVVCQTLSVKEQLVGITSLVCYGIRRRFPSNDAVKQLIVIYVQFQLRYPDSSDSVNTSQEFIIDRFNDGGFICIILKIVSNRR